LATGTRQKGRAMRRKLLWGTLGAVFVALVGGAVVIVRDPDLSAYEPFREPKLLTLPDQRVLVVESTGVPAEAAGKAFAALFGLYFKLPGVSRWSMPAPRARWPQIGSGEPVNWLGRFALPVPETLADVPSSALEGGLTLKLDTWHYGEVAQILHVGPYDQETPTIQRLQAFIAAQGYQVAGEHEEEYVYGPGMFCKGDPASYYTLIRYPIAKREAAGSLPVEP